MSSILQLRACSKCGEEKPFTSEYFPKNGKQGLRPECKVCKNAAGKRYYQDHREEIIERTGQYAKAHVEQSREKRRRCYWRHHERSLERSRRSNAQRKDIHRAWARANRERLTEQARKRREERREEYLAYSRAYYQAHKKEALHRWRIRDCRKKAIGGTHTSADIELQYKSQKGLCWWCEEPLNGVYEIDHRIPISRGGSNDARNICCSCMQCNRSKGSKLPHEWTDRLL